ncbi:MAG: heavy-metal-associated domain-containing protein [Candidatus Bipolaricaulia bacterium]
MTTQQKAKLKITGMTCQGCADTITRFLEKDEGVVKAEIDYGNGTGEVTFDAEVTDEERILKNRVFSAYYTAERAEEE